MFIVNPVLTASPKLPRAFASKPQRISRQRQSKRDGRGSKQLQPRSFDIRVLAGKRVGKGEHHGHADADKEGSVDQAGEQEHLRLKGVHMAPKAIMRPEARATIATLVIANSLSFSS